MRSVLIGIQALRHERVDRDFCLSVRPSVAAQVAWRDSDQRAWGLFWQVVHVHRMRGLDREIAGILNDICEQVCE